MTSSDHYINESTFSSILEIPDVEKKRMETFNDQITSRTSPRTKDIRRKEEEVNARDLRPSNNQANRRPAPLSCSAKARRKRNLLYPRWS